MTRLTKDYLHVGDHMSLDDLIAQLTEIRDALPPGAEPQVRLRGNEVFGQHLSIAFLRAHSEAEEACMERYGEREGLLRAA